MTGFELFVASPIFSPLSGLDPILCRAVLRPQLKRDLGSGFGAFPVSRDELRFSLDPGKAMLKLVCFASCSGRSRWSALISPVRATTIVRSSSP